jgi:hypothetical protein
VVLQLALHPDCRTVCLRRHKTWSDQWAGGLHNVLALPWPVKVCDDT